MMRQEQTASRKVGFPLYSSGWQFLSEGASWSPAPQGRGSFFACWQPTAASTRMLMAANRPAQAEAGSALNAKSRK